MAQYGRIYKDDEEREKRFQICKDNVEFIESFNYASNQPYKLNIDGFAYQSHEEFQASHNRYRTSLNPMSSKTHLLQMRT
ncbi:senescence-specific cysteine protease SAG39-like [Prunus yedoensis var. nudiflora]|uniref:Senescence-specific cysteine protease SAG39-like n=1 Tax=Prunus yedoensis var. nudiflora TaxID=2094558 RepID=A0A314YGE4_PRUYE|nr:senescence-specific cysteine protease SAG39-like [Prunus yedoensis var. nudiflora]